MTRTWWVKRLFRAAPVRRGRPPARPSLVRLEDRTAPAVVSDGGGTTLTVTLNDAGEQLTVVSAGTTYGFTTSAAAVKFQNGGVADANDFSNFNQTDLTLKASGLGRYDTIRVVDSAGGTKVTFVDSGGNAYSDKFQVTLDGGSAGVAFDLASDFGANAVELATDATLAVPSGAAVAGGGGITIRANAVAIDTSGTPGLVNGTGGRVTVAPFTAANAARLGADDAAGVVGLTDAELGQIKAAVLQVGEAASTGGVTVAGAVTAHAGYDTLALVTGGAVTQSAALAVANLRASAAGAVTLTDAGNAVGTLAAKGSAVTFVDPDTLTIDTVDGLVGVTSTGGDVSITTGADDLLTVGDGVSATGNATITTDRITIQAAAGVVAGGVVTVQQKSANWAIDLGSSTNLAANTLEMFTVEIGRLKAPTVRIGDPANAGGITLTDDVAADGGTAALVLRTAGAVTQTAGKTITAAGLAVSGSSVALDAAAHVVAAVAGQAAAGDFAFKSGNSPALTVGVVDGVTGVQAPAGTITIRSVNDLTATSALIDAGAKIALVIADGNPAGRTATVHGAFLNAPNGATITGGAGSDTFNLKASPTTKIDVDGGLPSPPASPGDTLVLDAESKAVAVTYQGPDGSKGKVAVTGLQPVGFKQIETLQVTNALSSETVVEGTPGNDVVVLEKSGGAVVFTLNGGAQLPVLGTKFTFNGLDGDDRMLVDFGGGDPALTGGVIFNGGNNTDTLQVDAAGLSGSYRPSGGDGGTVVVGTQKIAFATAERVDAFAAGTFAVVFPGANDTLTIANGKDFGSNTIDALVVSGAFAPVALWNNGTVAIDTADVGGLDGNDTVTVASANNLHAITNLSIRTGAGTDTVTINGPVNVTGSFAVDSVVVTVNATVTAGTTVTLTHTGTLQLGAVTVSGTAGVTETGGGAVTLTGNATAASAGGAVSFAGAIDALAAGVQSLTVSAGGAATFGGPVGGTNELASLTATGAPIAVNGGLVRTSGFQDYNSPVAVGAGTTFASTVGGAITFDATLSGGFDVAVNTTGATTFSGAVTVGSLTTSPGGTTQVNGGLVQTTGGQSYSDPVALGADAAFVSTGGGAVQFNGTLDGPGGATINTTGPTLFALAVGGVTPLAFLATNPGGSTQVNGGKVHTTGTQTFNDAVTVGTDAVFRSTGGQAVAFNSTLDGGFQVTVETTGATTFGGAVGGITPLAALTTNPGGTTQVNGGLIATVNAQTYNDPVAAGPNTTFQSTGGGAVTFNSTLTSGSTVAVNTAGATTFNGAVGVGALTTDEPGTTVVNTPTVTATGPGGLTFGDPVTALVDVTFAGTGGGPVTFSKTLTAAGKNVLVNTAGLTTFGGAVDVGSLVTNAGGTTAVNGGSVTTSGGQTYGDPVTVGAGTAFVSTGGGTIEFGGSLNGGFDVAVHTIGATRFLAPVGDVAPLASLTTNPGGQTQVNGGSIVTVGGQIYNDPVALGANAAFVSIGGGAVQFQATLDGPGGATINTTGLTRFALAVGGVTPLAFLTTNPDGSTQVNGGLVQTAGSQAYGDAVAVGANTLFAAGGGVSFASTLTGAGRDVTVNAAGQTTVGGPVFVGTLTTDAPGTTVLIATSVTTAGKQAFNDAVFLQAPGGGVTVLNSTGAGDVTFASSVDGPGGLAVVTGGTTTFSGPVGGAAPLASLATGGGGATVFGGGLVRTAAGQEYGDSVVLAAGTTFTSGTIVFFHQTLAGGFAAVTNSPQVVFQKAVDVGLLIVNAAAGPFAGVTVAGPTISATLGQSYALPVTVTGDTKFISAAGDVTFGQPLAGGFNVEIASPGTTTFLGPVDLASLTTDAGGATFVRGGAVTTSGGQQYNDAVGVADQNATFTSTGGGNVVFGATLAGFVEAAVNTAGVGRFDGQVNLASLTTDAVGVTIVNTGLVETLGDQSFGDSVGVNVPVVFRAGGDVLFGSSLGGLVTVVVQSPGVTHFSGPVNLDALATDVPGQTGITGGSVATVGVQSFGDPVIVGADTTFTSTGGADVTFGQTLTGPGRFVALDTAGATVLNGAVRVGTLVTNFGGTTAINGGLVFTDGSQLFNDPVTVSNATDFVAGDQVLFGQTLSGPTAVTIAAPGATIFGGQVSLGSLTTDAAGVTVVNTDRVQTSGGQEFGDGVSVNVATTFSGAAITFRSALSSGTSVALASGGVVTFLGTVAVRTLTTDAGGATVVRGGSVETTAGQSYGDDMVLGVTSRLATATGDLSFLGRIDAEAAGVQGLTAVAPAGTLLFAGAVGSAGPIAFLTADAVLTRLVANFGAAGKVALTARGGGVDQSAGFLTAANLSLFGSGTYTLDQLGTSAVGNDITGTFQANVSGPIRLADHNDLTVDAAGVVTGGHAVAIRTGRDFTAEDLRAAGKYGSPLVNVGGAEFRVDPGHFGPALVTFDAEVAAARALFGLGGANNAPDEFRVRPSGATPFEVNGNDPGNPLLPGQRPDVLVPLFSGAQVAGFTFDGSNGVYTFNDRAPITFRGFESLARRALAGFVVQTGEPRDATGATQIQYAVRIVQTQAVQEVVDGKVVAAETPVPLPGGLDGRALLQNPFVVAPSFVNPASPNAAPRLAFGDVNGDGAIDLILAEGPGSSPLVTVVNGLALNVQGDGTLRRLEDLVQQGQVLAQFYAYDPRFLGGVNVTAADLDGDGRAEIITGAEQGGGPHVRVFDGRSIETGRTPSELIPGFFVYEPTFTGGVRVAAADVNGDRTPDLVLGAGFNGGPRVTVVDGKTLAATGNRAEIANFFAYDPSFRGGIYVDAGDYDNDGFADILTGPGVGGGAHVRVFSGKTALAGSAPVELAGFFAFDQTTPDNPLFIPGLLPASGVGGVAFSGTSANGSRNILVGTGRGPQVQVKEFRGNGSTPDPKETVDLVKDQQFVVQGVNPETRVPNPIIFPLPSLLGYGASVGGFADPFAE